MGPFCCNPSCVQHFIEVPDDQTEIAIPLPDGKHIEMHRSLFVEEGHKGHWFCRSCENAINLVMGRGDRDPDPNLIVETRGELIVPPRH